MHSLCLDKQILTTSDIDLHPYDQSLEMSLYIKHDNICNFPFETEDDSIFRPSLTLKAVAKFASWTFRYYMKQMIKVKELRIYKISFLFQIRNV